ncbi:hypothetical protein LIER_43791 [Lithospermum erythrorhizon]|uniref:Uncharacterized protein n=1 Tax=Lithospermum erythrorhizon TaxID=34254 RepID=A0AAV3QTX4_LITER
MHGLKKRLRHGERRSMGGWDRRGGGGLDGGPRGRDKVGGGVRQDERWKDGRVVGGDAVWMVGGRRGLYGGRRLFDGGRGLRMGRRRGLRVRRMVILA